MGNLAGEDITAARLNENRDSVTFLGTPPSCRVYNSANISHVTSSTVQYLTFNSERFDTDTMHSTSTNTGRITATTAGKYAVGAGVQYAANATNQRGIALRLNGTTFINYMLQDTAATGAWIGTVASYYAFAATDYFETGGWQSSGGALNFEAAGNYVPEAWAAWQSL